MRTSWVGAVVLGLVGLSACGSNATPSAVPAKPTVTVTATPTAVPAFGERLTLRGACDAVVQTFRDGNQSDRQAALGLSTEAEGIFDSSGAEGRRALQPFIDAFEAQGYAENASLPRWQKSTNRAYDTLAKICRAAGSTALR